MAEALYKHLQEQGLTVSIEHRDMMKNTVEEDSYPRKGQVLDASYSDKLDKTTVEDELAVGDKQQKEVQVTVNGKTKA